MDSSAPTLQNDEKDSYELGAYPCHGFVAASQFFSLSKHYEVRREDSCAEVIISLINLFSLIIN